MGNTFQIPFLEYNKNVFMCFKESFSCVNYALYQSCPVLGVGLN